MRTIKFRGKRVDNGEWVYGSFLQFHPHHFAKKNTTIVEGGCIYYEVDPSTLGQFTGFYDKSGNEIYEGDHFGNTAFHVSFSNGSFNLGRLPLKGYLNGDYMEQIENIIGSIHDNPELLKQ